MSSPLSWASAGGLPKAEMRTRETPGGWACDLIIAGRYGLTNVSTISAADAESPFKGLVSIFSINYDSKDEGTKLSVGVTEDSHWGGDHAYDFETDQSTIQHWKAPPLVILVHGTWGNNSSWAIPGQPRLVKALCLRLTHPVEFRRFPWSGRNRPRERAKAAERLAAQLKNELCEYNRRIFVLAHSHGGNIAVRAVECLSEGDRKTVRCVLMATPFLTFGIRFDVRDVHLRSALAIRATGAHGPHTSLRHGHAAVMPDAI